MAKIDISKKVTSRLSLQPIKTDNGESFKFGGLVPARLVKIHLVEQNYTKGEFAGYPIKALAFEFENFKLNANEPDRFLTHTEKIIGTVKNEEGSPIPRDVASIDANIDTMWARIKHLFDQCVVSPNFRDIASIPAKDIEEYFNLPAEGTVEDRLAKFEAFFTYLANFANGDGDKLKPIYQNADGSGIAVWLKLVPNYPNRLWYELPTYVGQGFAEGVRAIGTNLPPAKIINIKATESLELARKGQSASVPMPGGADSGQGDAGGVPKNILDMIRGS